MDKTPSGLNTQLIPYPSLQNNVAGDCANGLSTVYRIKADKCGRLWVLDTGKSDFATIEFKQDLTDLYFII